MFDFKKLKAVDFSKEPLFAVLVGPQGSGKSTSAATLPGKTLMLHATIESHGPKAAAAANPKLVAIQYDRGENGEALTPDQAVANLFNILKSAEQIKEAGFTSLILDGFFELEGILMETKELDEFVEKSKGLRTFKAPEFVMVKFAEVVKLLQTFKALGLHVVTTVSATVKSDPNDMDVYELEPKLRGHNVAAMVCQSFQEVIPVGRFSLKDEESGQIETRHVFVFATNITKTSKDLKTKVVTKISTFGPRITGLLSHETPKMLKADLSLVTKFKSRELTLQGETE